MQLEHYIEIKIQLLFGKRVLPITQAIAATAIQHDLTVIIRNVRDFAGLGVMIFNPWELS